MKHLLFFLLITVSASFGHSQSEVSVQVELLTPDLIGEVVLEQAPFIKWVKSIHDDLEAQCAEMSGDKDVVVILTVHSNKDASIDVHTRPKVKNSVLNVLKKKISAHPSPRTKFNEYSLLISCQVNKGQSEGDFTPALVLPYDKKMAEFEALSLSRKYAEIQYWMRADILPLLAHFETNVDSAFAGVLSVGNLVKEGEFLQQATETITDDNPNYWRATMEMSKGNQLIPFTKACMFLANGEFDKAKRLLYVIRFFNDDSTIPAKLNGEISDKLNLYFTELGEEIEKGIALHDAQKYDDAIKHYKKLHKDFPNSAWLNYEIYFSESAKSTEGMIDKENWKKAQETIYACDPMYPINAQATSGKEGYLLFRRQEINGLFSSKEKLRGDFARYADIALDLKNYGFAAQLYWLTLSHLKQEDYDNRDLMAHYLYCLDKLGDKETIQNFKDDYSDKFVEIEKERDELMRNSFMYKAFEKDE